MARCLHQVASFCVILVFCSLALADSIDLQWALCDKDNQSVLRKLGLNGVEPYKEYNITYYDTATPKYTATGLAFRTKVHSKQPISMIKARFDEETLNVPSQTDCIWDQYGPSTFFTCSLASGLDNDTQAIWSQDQVEFAERYQDVGWDRLVAYGPYVDPKWRLLIAEYDAKFDDVIVEMTDSTVHLMEIEVNVDKQEAEVAYERITEYLKAHGITLCDEQIPKTLRLFRALEQHSSMVSDGRQKVLRHWKA